MIAIDNKKVEIVKHLLANPKINIDKIYISFKKIMEFLK